MALPMAVASAGPTTTAVLVASATSRDQHFVLATAADDVDALDISAPKPGQFVDHTGDSGGQ